MDEQGPEKSAEQTAVCLANEFLTRVWGHVHDLDAIDELMTKNYKLDSYTDIDQVEEQYGLKVQNKGRSKKKRDRKFKDEREYYYQHE